MNRVGRPISFAHKSNAAKSESQAMEEWGGEASLLVKRGMRDRGWGYGELSEALKTQGVKRSAAVINRRINRGNFSAGFLLVCLFVLESDSSAKTGIKSSTDAARILSKTKK